MSRLVEEQAVRRAAAAARDAKEAQEKEYCGVTDPTATPLARHFLSRRDAVCNDNSPAGYVCRICLGAKYVSLRVGYV